MKTCKAIDRQDDLEVMDDLSGWEQIQQELRQQTNNEIANVWLPNFKEER